MSAAPVRLIVLARAPVPGAAKTRLVPRLGPAGAARLHGRLVDRALGAAAAAAVGPVTLLAAGDPDDPAGLGPSLRALAARHGAALGAQAGGDLGARMRAALLGAPPPALLIGSDCPALTPGILREAAAALAGAPAVLLPVEDGGYALVGVAAPEARVLDALFSPRAWGHERVLGEALAGLAAAGAAPALLAPLWDVDRPEDLERLAADPALAGLLDGLRPDCFA